MDSLKVSWVLKTTPGVLYQDWLSSKGHSLFTGSVAKIDPTIGGKFSSWEGYIWGETLELNPGKRILQSWSTSNFPDGASPSLLEVLLEEVEGGTKITLNHSNIPTGQGKDYEQGWQDYYFSPMEDYYC